VISVKIVVIRKEKKRLLRLQTNVWLEVKRKERKKKKSVWG